MNDQKKKMLLIKLPYWLGIGADTLWAVGLLFPQVYGALTGKAEFNPDFQTMQILRIAGILMTGWTFILIWGVRKPVERRFIILLTAFVVIGISMVAFNDLLNGNTFFIWILIKSSLLIVTMITSYVLAGKEKLILA